MAQPPLKAGFFGGIMDTCHHFILVQSNRQRAALGQKHTDSSTARHSHLDSLIPRAMKRKKVSNATDNLRAPWVSCRCHSIFAETRVFCKPDTKYTLKTSAQPQTMLWETPVAAGRQPILRAQLRRARNCRRAAAERAPRVQRVARYNTQDAHNSKFSLIVA